MEELTTLQGWENCLAQSEQHPIMLFKHSTRCPISSSAYDCVQTFLDNAPEGCPTFFLVKVVESRPISNAIAETLCLVHKSPQIILLDHRQAVWSTSHYNITEANLRAAIADLKNAGGS